MVMSYIDTLIPKLPCKFMGLEFVEKGRKFAV